MAYNHMEGQNQEADDEKRTESPLSGGGTGSRVGQRLWLPPGWAAAGLAGRDEGGAPWRSYAAGGVPGRASLRPFELVGLCQE